jgi:predicted DsbA family dithiol-disulfide isomerase
MRCEDFEHYSAEYLAGTLPASADFIQHLEECSHCRAEIEGLRNTWTDLRQIEVPMRTATMKPDLLAELAAVNLETHHTPNWRKFMPYALGSLLIVVFQIGSAFITRNAPVPNYRGAADAPVTLVEYGDYECPPCARYNPVLKDLLQRYAGRLRLEYRHYPLTPVHPNAMLAAAAAEAAGQQGHYWEMNDLLFEAQTRWAHAANAEETFIGFASQLGLDKARFMEALHGPAIQQRISHDIAEAREAQLDGTPTFLLNGKRIYADRVSIDAFATLIDAALKGTK